VSTITYVSQYFVSADQPGGVRHWQHTRALARAGHRVSVITSYVQHKERTVPERYAGRRVVHEVEDGLGPVDVLVNNAGIAPVYPSLHGVTEELFDKIVSVNLKGPFRMMAVAGRRMAARGGGAMLNISSMASGRPTAGDLPYAAAKAALNTLTAGFAQEYGPTVRVNTIVAGPFRTDISASWDMAAVDEMARSWPSRRVGEPSEIVGAALYLCGPTASYTTGSLLAVDGGRLAAP